MGATTVRRAAREDWADLRDVRLAALTEAPYAFASNLAREVDRPDAHWQDWPDKHAVFLAYDPDGRPVGLAAGIPGDVADLISVWTHPDHRGTDLSTTLITALIEWARADGASRINAWVVENNERAMAFYVRLGFAKTGAEMAYPNDPSLTEYELTKVL
ncbi:GNAT family N-acetyltransferase [Actinokineospora auranticolor]|uniref:Ribosomal protein S18 acetylase RimI-like enzyme n=1 Tax=Actinokineospora auranticolor TaxID=155976 RepID=A0A2S6GYB2_9PSEU|nr:GNAT family N-acetyltransferase [Actinokineospora auranticolor]PPK70151.1 ribosomal protein S18 acetylase RimI-like enzyme [Actinokineospora auranticolor]